MNAKLETAVEDLMISIANKAKTQENAAEKLHLTQSLVNCGNALRVMHDVDTAKKQNAVK